jgi:hypothetical protein
MQNQFVPDFGCQNHIFLPRMVNFACNIPITGEYNATDPRALWIQDALLDRSCFNAATVSNHSAVAIGQDNLP